MKIEGFRFGAVDAGIRKRAAPDLALILAERPVPTAAVFTRNLVVAAPVIVARERAKSGRAQAVLVNAGCANACTGTAGLRAARLSTAALAREVKTETEWVLPASTGVIGQLLPSAKIVAKIPELVASIGEDATAFSRAILTTDRGPKVAEATVRIGGTTVRLLGIAKGAGMIHPDMATTLGFVTTDADVSSALLRSALRTAASTTFNAASVDGDTSTNDTLILMASGAARNRTLARGSADERRFTAALREVLGTLADLIVADGEGAEHLVRIHVRGAPSDRAARHVARTIATSPLVKTALHGKDPNWGRIVAAAGRAGVPFDPTRVELRVGGVVLVRHGVFTTPDAETRAHAVMKRERYAIELRLAAGKGAATVTTCDMGHEYVRINADYRS